MVADFRLALVVRSVSLEYLDDARLSEVARPVERRAVVLAVADPDIGAGGKQPPDDLHVSPGRREVQRRHLSVPMRPATVWIGASPQEPDHSQEIVSLRHHVQRARAD